MVTLEREKKINVPEGVTFTTVLSQATNKD
jgi:hypothetical protein